MSKSKIYASASKATLNCNTNQYLRGYWERQKNTDDCFQLQSNWDTHPDPDVEPIQELLDAVERGEYAFDPDPIEEVLCALERGEVDQFITTNPRPEVGFRRAGSLWEGAVLPVGDAFIVIPPSERLAKIREKIFEESIFCFESPVTFVPTDDRSREFKDNLNHALQILKEEKGIEFEETTDGLGLRRKKKGIN